MHNAAFRHSGIEACYVPFDVSDIKAAMQAARTLRIRGISITVPHKIPVIPYLDHVDNTVQKIGAVNTVVNRDGALFGTNTDGIGAIRALSKEAPLKGKRIVVIGAGGAARAIGFGVQSVGGKVIIVNRTIERGQKLAADLGCDFVPLDDITSVHTDILVNATTVGMHPDSGKSPAPSACLKPGMVVMDSVYSPLSTRLLKDAQKQGCVTINGLDMLIYQGAAQFEIWTGEKAPVEVMWKAAKNKIENQ
jgi:shikimate dehydrogenase